MDVMLENLGAGGPHPTLPEKMDIYGRVLGSWHIANHQFDEAAGVWRDQELTWHFGRILDGLGVQDVLRSEHGSGTTIRVYDRATDAWRVSWNAPRVGNFATLIGRLHGDQIHQDGTGHDGRPLRWNFSEIEPDSFLWEGHISADGGTTWRLEQQMRATRLG